MGAGHPAPKPPADIYIAFYRQRQAAGPRIKSVHATPKYIIRLPFITSTDLEIHTDITTI